MTCYKLLRFRIIRLRKEAPKTSQQRGCYNTKLAGRTNIKLSYEGGGHKISSRGPQLARGPRVWDPCFRGCFHECLMSDLWNVSKWFIKSIYCSLLTFYKESNSLSKQSWRNTTNHWSGTGPWHRPSLCEVTSCRSCPSDMNWERWIHLFTGDSVMVRTMSEENGRPVTMVYEGLPSHTSLWGTHHLAPCRRRPACPSLSWRPVLPALLCFGLLVVM